MAERIVHLTAQSLPINVEAWSIQLPARNAAAPCPTLSSLDVGHQPNRPLLEVGSDPFGDHQYCGPFRLDLSYFGYCIGLTMTNERFSALFSEPVPARAPEMPYLEREAVVVKGTSCH